MGMEFFTDKLQDWNIRFALFAMSFCVIGRIMNIFPLSFLSNLCRRRSSNPITWPMQFVLCFAGLRGAIAFALAMNMPGPNAETYTTVTLIICSVTTVVCGGFTERILDTFGMKQIENTEVVERDSTEKEEEENENEEDQERFGLFSNSIVQSKEIRLAYDGIQGLWADFDFMYLRPMFGGPVNSASPSKNKRTVSVGKGTHDGLGDYELGSISFSNDDNGDDEQDALWQE
jgi:hypothetical protein